MKKSAQWGFAALLLVSPLFAKEKDFPKINQIIELTQIDNTLLNELILGMHPDVVVECKEGTTLPLSFLQNNQFFSVKWVPNLVIHVNQRCYFRLLGDKPYVSQNLVTWEKASKILDPKYDFHVSIDSTSGITIETNLSHSQSDDSDPEE